MSAVSHDRTVPSNCKIQALYYTLQQSRFGATGILIPNAWTIMEISLCVFLSTSLNGYVVISSQDDRWAISILLLLNIRGFGVLELTDFWKQNNMHSPLPSIWVLKKGLYTCVDNSRRCLRILICQCLFASVASSII